MIGTTRSPASTSYPAAFAVIDDAAKCGQRRHFMVLRIHLIALVAAAALQVLAGPLLESAAPWLGWLVVASIVVALLAGVALRLRRWSRRWSVCRATAENIKSDSWYYMMGLEPGGAPGRGLDDDADARFRRRTAELLATCGEALTGKRGGQCSDREPAAATQPGLPGLHVSAGEDLYQIPSRMKEVRGVAQPASEQDAQQQFKRHVDEYRAGRVEDQIGYYRGAAARHMSRHHLWTGVVVVSEGIVLVLALLAVLFGLGPSSAMAAVLTAAAAASAWSAARRHQELAYTYGRMGDLLDVIQAALGGCEIVSRDEGFFHQIVEATERLLSQENMIWGLQACAPHRLPIARHDRPI